MKNYLLVILLFTTSAIAQKSPTIQVASLRAPTNIKIDGKATEWDNQFQANNKTTEIFYTIANDSENLYLIIRATDETTIKKIVMGGITFTVNTANKRDTKNAPAITFPVYDSNNPPSYFTFNKSKIDVSTNVDSLMNIHNKALSTKYKLIGIAGIEAITDSLLSIYNKEDIMASAKFDGKLNYTYEMAVPLKYLKVTGDQKLLYNIKLNAATIDGRKLEIISPRPNLNIVQYIGTDGVNYQLGNDPHSLALVAPTDFWGEYTLAK
jgi:hypothetical protein